MDRKVNILPDCPGEKKPNGADKFRSDHLAEYESYESQNQRNYMRDVNHQNRHPKMADVLEKKRTVARTTDQTDKIYFDPNCRLCKKLKLAMENKKRAKPKRNYSRNDRRKKTPGKKSRLYKSRKSRNTRTNKRSRVCAQYDDQTMKDVSGLSNDVGIERRIDDEDSETFSDREETESRNSEANVSSQHENSHESLHNTANPPNSRRNASISPQSRHSTSISPESLHNAPMTPESLHSKSISSEARPITSTSDVMTSSISLISYDSDMSLDHEPMVSSKDSR